MHAPGPAVFQVPLPNEPLAHKQRRSVVDQGILWKVMLAHILAAAVQTCVRDLPLAAFPETLVHVVLRAVLVLLKSGIEALCIPCGVLGQGSR